MKSEIFNRAKYIIVAMAIVVFSYCVSSFYNEGTLIIPTENKIIEYNASGTEEYDVTLKNIFTEGDEYTSLSIDPIILISFKDPQIIEEVKLNLSVSDEDNKTMFQVFYRDSEGFFSEVNSVKASVSSGEYSIELPVDEKYAELRLDISDEQGTTVTISSVKFCQKKTGPLLKLLPVFLICVIYFSAAFVLFLIKIAGKVSESRFCLGELLLTVLFTTTVVFAKMYGDGNVYAYTIMGTDTINAYIPSHMFYSDSLREVNFDLWSAEFGYGGSVFSGMYDPLMVCVILLTAILGKGFLIHGLVIHKIGCLLLSAYFCYKFLCLFSDKYPIAAIASYLYAFNGFGNIWGQHYHFMAYPTLTIMVFYGVERFLRREKKCSFFVIIISGICMAISVYPCYMIYLSAAVYALIRYVYMVDRFQIKPFISKIIYLLANVLIGFGTGMAFSLPYIETILNSGRISGNGILPRIWEAIKLNFFEPWWDVPRRMLTGPQLNYRIQYYEDPQLFFSVISVVLLLQFIFTVHKIYKKPRQMVCVYLSVGLVLFSVYNGLVPSVLNAFVAVRYRGLYVLFPAAALMTLSVLDNIRNKKIFSYEALAVGGIISVSALLLPYIYTDVNDLNCKDILPACIVLLIFSVCLLIRLLRSKKQYAMILLCAVLVFDCTAELNAVIANQFDIMPASTYEEKEANGQETSVLLNYVRETDDDYYRIDKTYCDFNVVTDSLCENYRSLTLYKSTDAVSMRAFYSEYLNGRYTHSLGSKMYYLDPYELVQWSMTGLRYVLSTYESYDTDHFIPVTEHNGRTLYRLSDSESFGTFYTKAVSFDEFSGLDYGNKTKVLQSSMILEEDFEGSPYGVTVSEAVTALGEKNITGDLFPEKSLVAAINEEGQREIFLPENWAEGMEGEIFIEYSFLDARTLPPRWMSILDARIPPLRWMSTIFRIFRPTTLATQNLSASLAVDNGDGYISVATTSIPAGTGVSERFTLPRSAKSIRFDLQERVTMNSLNVIVTEASLRPNEANAVIKDTGSDSHITADINCPENGLLFMPIPFDKDWSAYVDGMEAKIIPANSGFMAVDLTSGEHRVEFIYKNKAFIYGIVISLVSCMIALMFWYLENKRSNLKNKKESVKEK